MSLPDAVMVCFPGWAASASGSTTMNAVSPLNSADNATRSGSRNTVRWAMPSPIITAAAMNATIAKTKRTNYLQWPHEAAPTKDIPHYCRCLGVS